MKRIILTLAAIISLVGVMVSPMTVMATPGTGDLDTLVTGEIVSYYTVAAPLNFTMANLLPAGGNSGSKTLAVATNDAVMANVKVEVKGTSGQDGRLKSATDPLSSALILTGTGLTTRTLSDNDQTLIAAGSLEGADVEKTWSVADLVITQPAFTAVAAGTYTITITFTVTFSS